MNKFLGFALKALGGVAAGAIIAGSASAADLAAPEAVEAVVPSMFDVAFGVAGVTDYRFRGITQSKKDPAVQGYFELQTDWVYAGVWGSSVNFPRPVFTDPSMEIDFYGGFRHTWDSFTLDLGGIYYYYPGEQTFKNRPPALGGQLRELDYWEIYARPAFSFGDFGSITGNIFWTSDYINVSSDALYLAVIPKVNIPLSAFPDLAFYASGEIGHQSVKKNLFGVNPPDYWTWNVGVGATYKAMTLDVRYSDTDLSKRECATFSGVRGWCGDTIIGKIAFDTSLNKLK